MAKIDIFSAPHGINTEPVAKGDWQAASEMENLLVDFATADITLRHSVTPITATGEVHRTGNRIGHLAVHNPNRMYNRFFRYRDDETFAHVGERLFIASRAGTKWYDASSFREYDFGFSKPAVGTPGVYQITAARESSDRAAARFVMAFTFYNDQYGLETPASDAWILQVIFNYDDKSHNIRTHYAMPSIPFDEAPAWSQGCRIYMSQRPIEDGNVDDFGQHIQTDVNNVVKIDTNYVIETLGIPMVLVEEFTGVAGGSLQVRTLVDLEFSGSFNTTQTPRDGLAKVALNLSKYLSGNLANSPTPKPPVLEHLLLYAGRLWGYSPELGSIVFSFIDGKGISRYDIFPSNDAVIPHQINVAREVMALAAIPNNGGIYVFYRDGIQTIRGQSIITGLFSTDVEPFTDLDASGGIPDFGTLSPKSVCNYRNTLVFFGSDKRLYQIAGTQVKDIGFKVQGFLDQVINFETVACEVFDDKVYVSLKDISKTLVLDMTRAYWTSYDYATLDMFRTEDNRLLGMLETTLVQGYFLEDPHADNSELPWKWVSQEITLPDIATLCGIYVQTAPPYKPIVGTIWVDGVAVMQEKSFTPAYANRFLQGFYGRGTRVKVQLTGVGEPPHIENVALEFN